MHKNKQNKKDKKYNPNKFIWFLYRKLSKFVCKHKFNLIIDRQDFDNRNKEEGCIVLFNHNCNSDFWIQGAIFNKEIANIVVTKRFKYIKRRNFFLKRAATIFKDQFVPDINSILQIKHALKMGHIVSLAPTGTVSIHGGNLPIFPATVKLLKKFNVDVYYIQSIGNYLAEPKWATNKRKYQVHTSIKKILSKETLENISNEECMNIIMNYAATNDHNTKVNKDYEIKGKNLTQGLEKILFICPECLKQEIIYHDNLIECTYCHNQVRYNKYGYLDSLTKEKKSFDDEEKWYYFQTNYYLDEIKKESFSYTSNVSLYTDTIIKDKYICVGKGLLTLNKEECYYEGEFMDENKQKVKKRIDFSLLVPELSFVPCLRFNIPNEEGIFEFIPEDKKDVMRFVQMWEALQIYKTNINN